MEKVKKQKGHQDLQDYQSGFVNSWNANKATSFTKRSKKATEGIFYNDLSDSTAFLEMHQTTNRGPALDGGVKEEDTGLGSPGHRDPKPHW